MLPSGLLPMTRTSELALYRSTSSGRATSVNIQQSAGMHGFFWSCGADIRWNTVVFVGERHPADAKCGMWISTDSDGAEAEARRPGTDSSGRDVPTDASNFKLMRKRLKP